MRRRTVPAERILIVDDDESIRQIVHMCLSDEGYEIIEASNGQAALALVDDFQPNLILLDLRMPVMDGWEFARRYQTLPGPHVPIVAFAACSTWRNSAAAPQVRPGSPGSCTSRRVRSQRGAVHGRRA
jgi:CheY-like chemotaxis protein